MAATESEVVGIRVERHIYIVMPAAPEGDLRKLANMFEVMVGAHSRERQYPCEGFLKQPCQI